MYEECKRTNSPSAGGIIFDEIHLQPGIQLQKEGEGLKLFGYANQGENHNGLSNCLNGGNGLQIATTVLQFVFLAFNGFRFPFSYVLCSGISTGELTSLLWDIINTLKYLGFKIHYICMDGASINRSLVNQITLPGTAKAPNITTLCSSISCIMDFSHVVKKIRNNIYSSGTQSFHNRQLQHPLGSIYCQFFTDAYNWDKQNHYLPIHRKLTSDHFHLTTNLKMRNHLAEEVLNKDMLYLFKQYQNSLPQPFALNGVIALPEKTSLFIDIFRSPQPIDSIHDSRLQQLDDILSFFNSWADYSKEEMQQNFTTRKDNKKPIQIFLTTETHTDLRYCISGFQGLCMEVVDSFTIIPKLINSDICENIFCQMRATYNGANSNPDASQYRYIFVKDPAQELENAIPLQHGMGGTHHQVNILKEGMDGMKNSHHLLAFNKHAHKTTPKCFALRTTT